ncbi:unnamed protein product [Adineta ricciae]|uniref:Uncharacterized protein n=1 Tax=Adineta ricciae TaxID=249248 RepID=A0A814X7E8_ADIRI|nr:unnamed protein product [Adineta ricciae]
MSFTSTLTLAHSASNNRTRLLSESTTAGLFMDFTGILFGFLVIIVVVLFLGALNYFLSRSQSNTQSQTSSSRTNACSMRRKQARLAKKNQRLQQANTINENLNSNTNEKHEAQSTISKGEGGGEEEEEQSSVQPTDDDNEEFYDAMKNDEVINDSPSTSIPPDEEPLVPVKQRKKNKVNSKPSIESILPKPQASVVPVKQTQTSIPSPNIPIDQNSKSNARLPPSYNLYAYPTQKSLPPRFQQRQHRDLNSAEKLRRRKPSTPIRKSAIQPEAAARQNDFVPLSIRQQTSNKNNHLESSHHNGYSSESDNLSETPSTIHTDNAKRSSTISTSTDSQLDLVRSLSTSNSFVNDLVTLFDRVPFSSDELELILNKISTKQLLNRQDWQRLLATNSAKNDKTIERILDETYRSQAKILAIELQNEKNRVLELTKTNAEMENTVRQLQQPNNSLIPYQQTIHSYQMQLRRLTDDNTRLAHQLHAYSMMPGSINELKQQQQILQEQLQQLTQRNSALEQEIADGQLASKHAAEIYKKADAQKQERIEQMLIDLNKYKKIDKDLAALQQKHKGLEKSSKTKLNDLIQERNELQKSCEKLQEQLQQDEQIKHQYDELVQNQTQVANLDELQQELAEVKAKNDTLRQRNLKIMEQLNKLRNNNSENQTISTDAI